MKRIAVRLGAALAGAMMVLGGGACGAIDQTALGDLEDCVNGVDDNADGLADCADPQCAGHAACLAMREMDCDNGADDDGDGLTDCADPDCQETAECDPTREWSCHDGVDNDGDGLPDCLDPDCQEACSENCTDGVDNNGNGLVDCDDPACAGIEGCHGGGELCNNGIDDDGDGLKDCLDPDCADRPLCRQVEICNNELDDDGDGLNNCADPDCALSPYCLEIECLDGQDNDEDGFIDCDDSDCANALACQSTTECLPAQPLSCGQIVESTTVGRLNNFSTYTCQPGSFPGPERYFQFTAARDTIVEISLLDWDARGLTMFATGGDPNGGCNFGDACIPQPLPGDPYLPVSIDEGATMFLIVDGTTATPGPFDLWFECTPTDEVGLCGDGLDNDYDGWPDCWDEDCVGDPGCDYWVSAGLDCTNDLHCAPGEYCELITFQGTMNTVGFCTRDCSSVGAMGGECATLGYGDGVCSNHMTTQDPRCLLPCPTTPGDYCPVGSQCTDMFTGSATDPANGYCLPIQ